MSNVVNNVISEAKRRAAVERMWLSHYNNTLLQKGLISPAQHHKMKIYISTRKPLSTEH